MKKALFFDIDGTLMQHGKKVMPSTVEAIKKVRQEGHLVFVCTGRARVMIPHDPILQIGFDGIIASCGMYGEYQEKVVFQEELEQELLDKTLEMLENYNAVVILEGNENLYYSTKSHEKREKHWFEEEIEKDLPDNLLSIEEHKENLHVSKWSCIAKKEEADKLFAEFENDYEVMRHEELVAEFIGKGHTKGVGVYRMCEYLGIPIEDTISFGDSINDEAMLKICGIGVAMGNGSKIAKESADYITDSIEENGIYNACVHFELIEA